MEPSDVVFDWVHGVDDQKTLLTVLKATGTLRIEVQNIYLQCF